MEKFGKFVLMLILILISVFVQGLVFMYMWNWFIISLGIVSINFFQAIGIMITIRLINSIDTTDENRKDFNTRCIEIFSKSCAYLIIWGIGAIIVLFI